MTFLHRNEKLTAVVGAHNLRQNEGSVRIGVKSYHIHPHFNMHTLQNDIMLLRVTVVQMTVIKTINSEIIYDSACLLMMIMLLHYS